METHRALSTSQSPLNSNPKTPVLRGGGGGDGAPPLHAMMGCAVSYNPAVCLAPLSPQQSRSSCALRALRRLWPCQGAFASPSASELTYVGQRTSTSSVMLCVILCVLTISLPASCIAS